MNCNSAIRMGVLAMLLAVPAQGSVDPCLSCDVMHASGCNTGLWRLDLVAGTSTLIATMPEVLFDIAITADGRLTEGGPVVALHAPPMPPRAPGLVVNRTRPRGEAHRDDG